MQVRVAFLSPNASFTHQAALELFGSSAEFIPCPSFDDIFSSVQQNESDYAVIPFENSTNGSVVQTLDLLADWEGLYNDITVCDEHYLPAHHCLLVRSGVASEPVCSDIYRSITKLYTHPQAWGQCEAFLSKHFKGVERHDVSSTSKAAEIISEDTSGHSAAIASGLAAEYYGVEALATNIEDRRGNTTRFLILRNNKSEQTKDRCAFGHNDTKSIITRHEESPLTSSLSIYRKRKALVAFTVTHSSPGALADALQIFKTHGMNLTSINSRPGPGREWQYIFFVEFEITPHVDVEDHLKNLFDQLREATEFFHHLGDWKDRLLQDV